MRAAEYAASVFNGTSTSSSSNSTISGGSVTAIGNSCTSTGSKWSSGILAEHPLTISGGTVSASGGASGKAFLSDGSGYGTLTVSPAAGVLRTRVSNSPVNAGNGVTAYDTNAGSNFEYHRDTTANDSRYARISPVYAISGTVADADGNTVDDVTVTVSGESGSTPTDIDGNYTIYAENGSHTVTAADLDAKYAVQAFTLVHQKADGTYEYFYATADADSNVTFGPLYELSPFMLVKGTLAQAPVTVADISVVPPQTGDGDISALMAGIAMLGAAAIAAGAYAIKRKRNGTK